MGPGVDPGVGPGGGSEVGRGGGSGAGPAGAGSNALMPGRTTLILNATTEVDPGTDLVRSPGTSPRGRSRSS